LSGHPDDSLIIRIWHEITVDAIDSRASDIHIEAGLPQYEYHSLWSQSHQL